MAKFKFRTQATPVAAAVTPAAPSPQDTRKRLREKYSNQPNAAGAGHISNNTYVKLK